MANFFDAICVAQSHLRKPMFAEDVDDKFPGTNPAGSILVWLVVFKLATKIRRFCGPRSARLLPNSLIIQPYTHALTYTPTRHAGTHGSKQRTMCSMHMSKCMVARMQSKGSDVPLFRSEVKKGQSPIGTSVLCAHMYWQLASNEIASLPLFFKPRLWTVLKSGEVK